MHVFASSLCGYLLCVQVPFLYIEMMVKNTVLLHRFLLRFVSANVFFDVVCRIVWNLVVYMWNTCLLEKFKCFGGETIPFQYSEDHFPS